MHINWSPLGIIFFLSCLFGCGGGNGGDSGGDSYINSVIFSEPWPSDINAVFTATISESSNDYEMAPGGAPPYSTPVRYLPIDVI